MHISLKPEVWLQLSYWSHVQLHFAPLAMEGMVQLFATMLMRIAKPALNLGVHRLYLMGDFDLCRRLD